jgi:hypothetical protein
LLDDTHLRFFTGRTVLELFESAGYVFADLDRLKVHPRDTELRIDPAVFPPEVAAFAMRQDDATTSSLAAGFHGNPIDPQRSLVTMD